jgi:hypothetical protein
MAVAAIAAMPDWEQNPGEEEMGVRTKAEARS